MQATEHSDAHRGSASLNLDRRVNDRFPLQQELQYRTIEGKGPRVSGQGLTLNMSSSGLYFSTEQQLPLGRMVEVSVNWPARLDNNCLLKFVATGRIVRSEDRRAAVRIDRYEFRTRSANPITRVQAPLS